MSQNPFIIYSPEQERTGQSSARVHAARTAYWRRREQYRLDPAASGPSQTHRVLVEGSEEGPPKALFSLQQAVIDRSASPESILSQGRLDPFDCMPGGRMPQNVRKALDYAWEIAFTEGTSTTRLNEAAPITTFWKHECTNSSTLLHLQLQLAIEMPMAQTFDQEESLSEIATRHKVTAYRLMRQEIEEFERVPNNVPSDALILALFSSNFLSQPLSISPAECHPASPLATTQLLHAYGRVPLIPGHTRALHNLVQKRGGLADLRQGGIADLVQLHDLRTASQTGEKPLFHWIGPEISINTARLVEIHRNSSLRGFKRLRARNGELWEALTMAGEVTIALDQYQRSGDVSPRLQEVVIAANSVQHALCCLPLAQLSADSTANNSIYEICRLAGLIYSDMVLFPLPACTGVKPRLAAELRGVLETASRVGLLDAENSELVLWATFLATVAATFSQDREWFVSRLALSMVKSVVPFDFHCFKNMMQNYLWWEPVLDEPASAIWNDVYTQTGPMAAARI